MAGLLASSPVMMASEAIAQTQPASDDKSKTTEGVEEIVVYAQRREQLLRDVSVAVTAITGDNLQSLGVVDSSELRQIAPNLNIGTTYPGIVPSIILRGVGVNDYSPAIDPSVSTYVDQVYLGSTSSSIFSLFDVDRVEVLRGPQGTLYGKNTNGGAINVYTRRPTDELTGDFRAGYGNYGQTEFEGGIGGPIVDGVLSARISGYSRNLDGYGNYRGPDRGATTPKDNEIFGQNAIGVRAQLLLKPAPGVEFLATYGHARSDYSYAWAQRGLRSPANPNMPCLTDPLLDGCVDNLGEQHFGDIDIYSTIQDKVGRNVVTSDLYSLLADIDIGGATLTSVTGYIDTSVDLFDDGGGDGPEDAFLVSNLSLSKSFSQEVRLSSTGSNRFDYTIGAFYSNLKDDSANVDGFSGFVARAEGGRRSSSYAFFGQGTYKLSDQFAVLGGLRYSSSKRRVFGRTDFGPDFADGDSWSSVGGKAAIEFRPAVGTLIYASYSRGFKEGNVLGNQFAATTAKVDPETIDAFEIGAKTGFLDNRVTLSATGFYNKLHDMQVTSADPNFFNFARLTNAAAARTYGFELELAARFGGFSGSLNYGYLDAKYSEYTLVSVLAPFNLANNDPRRQVDASGNAIPLASKHTLNGSIQYDAISDLGTFTPRFGFTYRSAYNLTPEGPNPRARQPNYWLLNASLGYQAKSGFGFEVWARNLTKTAYLLSVTPSDSFNGTDYLTYGLPRMYGATARFRF